MTGPVGLEVKITNRCNQRCLFCMNEDGPDSSGDLDVGLLTRRLEEWHRERRGGGLSIAEVRITGGEPLLRLQGVKSIARTCRSLGLPSGVNTNGTLLGKGTIAALREEGLELVKVSFDTLDGETLRVSRGGGFSPSLGLEGVRLSRRAGLRVLLRFTLGGHNLGQLLPCYRRARDLGVERFQVKPVIPAGRAVSGGAPPLEREVVTRSLEQLAREAGGEGDTPAEVLCWHPEDAGGLSTKPCGSIDKLYVSTNGKVISCNYLPDALPLGDLRRDSLAGLLDRRRPTLRRSGGHEYLDGCPLWESTGGGHRLPARSGALRHGL